MSRENDKESGIMDSEFRYERKFILENLSIKEILNFLMKGFANFKEVYEGRYINNIYLDDLLLTSFSQNISGCSERKKIRIRWYGKLFGNVEKPVLEIKIKHGVVGTKKIINLDPFTFQENTDFKELLNGIISSLEDPIEKENLRILRPVLVNRYYRRYFLSWDKKFRVTIDDRLNFFGVQGNRLRDRRNETINLKIVELKYKIEDEKYANKISTSFPMRVSRFSKYCSGYFQH